MSSNFLSSIQKKKNKQFQQENQQMKDFPRHANRNSPKANFLARVRGKFESEREPP